jgi:uncharacterized protein
MYFTGQGVPIDYSVAYMWFIISSTKGYTPANEGKDYILKRMTQERIAEAHKMSREWLEQREKRG